MTEARSIYQPGEIEIARPYLSKGEYVYQVLKGKIANGYLERNKTYTIVEIAEKLGVSRTPVGEAVKILASQDYVIMYPGVGFKIKELTIEDIRENLIISGALEEAVLRKIIQDQDTTIEPLQRAVERSWQAIKNNIPELYIQASSDFHKALFALSRLRKLTEIVQENVFGHELWYREGAIRYPQAIERLIVDHEAIIALIQMRNEKQITDVIQNHVEHCQDLLIKVIKG
ncbi:MAG TPA: GntR family transcriptional regulator [Anaerolineaceae bacterium]|nr:GntR family transcriptional regulator [Anaerolineaceae bacterium]